MGDPGVGIAQGARQSLVLQSLKWGGGWGCDDTGGEGGQARKGGMKASE